MPRIPPPLVIATLLLVVQTYDLRAQPVDFSGNYQLVADREERLELLLRQDFNGGIRGTLSGPNGTFEINAYIDRGIAVGTMHVGRDPIDFEAWLDGAHLVVSLGGVPAGRLAYLPTQELLFTKTLADPYDYGTRPGPGRDPLEGRDPHGSGNPLAPISSNTALSFTGTFSDGHVVLELRGGGDSFTGHLSVDGRDYPVQARVREGVLTGSFSNRLEEFQFVAARDAYGLSLETDGQSYYLRYQEDFGPGPSGTTRILSGNGPYAPMRTGPLSDGTPEGIRWAEWFRGSRLVSYGNGRALAVDLTLCHDGRFVGQPPIDPRSNAPAFAFTESDGTWRVTAPMGAASLELRTRRGQLLRYGLAVDRGQPVLDGYLVTLEQAAVGC